MNIIDELNKWDHEICELSKDNNLDWFPISYEICDYYEMIGHMSYHGMPTHYAHWSFGKSFERTHQMYNLGLEGLPYELIINSNPSIAYLMRQNPMYLQILIMAHCVGHSDFFKNNHSFSQTRPEHVISDFRNAGKRIQSYMESPHIGVKNVERILDAAHAIQFQVYRYPTKDVSHEEQRKEWIQRLRNDEEGKYKNFDIDKVPLEPEHDILKFIIEHSDYLDDWAIDILEIVRRSSQYFIPQIKTKIMNEGWASYWHYRTMHELELPQKYHLPFLKSHNQVVQPHIGRINPYHLGFHLFNKIEERYGIEECFFARENLHDESFLYQYITDEDIKELNLFTYAAKDSNYIIQDIADDDGVKNIKKDLIRQVGTNSIPVIYVDDVGKGNILTLVHEFDGRELELDYADEVISHLQNLWGDVVKLKTVIDDEDLII
jgi:stage V sporulation protein R